MVFKVVRDTQVRPETMESIRDKLNRQQNFKIQNEPSASPSNNQPCSVEIRWGPMVQAKLKYYTVLILIRK